MSGTSETTIVVLVSLLVVSAATPVGAANIQADPDCEGETWTGVDKELDGRVEVRYTATFNQQKKLVCFSAENVGEIDTYGRFVLIVDDRTVPTMSVGSLSTGETCSVRRNVTGWIDVTAENHSVKVSTYADGAQFNFTERFNDSKEGGFPSPYITDVEVLRNQSAGETTLEVTATNPANRSYFPSVVVKTFETDTYRELPSTPDNHTLVYHVPLEEAPGETVVGDIKLYDHWKYSDGKFDRKEFVAKPNDSIRSWEPAFEEVPNVSQMNAEIYYENESAKKFRDQGPDVKPISEQASRIGAVATVLLVVGGIWWRRRRKFR